MGVQRPLRVDTSSMLQYACIAKGERIKEGFGTEVCGRGSQGPNPLVVCH